MPHEHYQRKFDHITLVVVNLHWLPVILRRKYNHIFASSDLIFQNSISSNPRSSDSNIHFLTRFKRSTTGGRSFSCVSLLPLESFSLHSITSITQFKTLLKTQLVLNFVLDNCNSEQILWAVSWMCECICYCRTASLSSVRGAIKVQLIIIIMYVCITNTTQLQTNKWTNSWLQIAVPRILM